ncbi:MAG: hypothetical protein MUC90_04260 [Thermoplasmata archaeon]|jgi:uncharacterized coiled-coil DUF342 family protein|nr:hypothetical protein [Thermoplasmata archaeon]
MPPKKISEIQSAELKFRALLNKRDEINEQAAVLRSERDSLNEQKKVLQEQMRTARDKRDAFVAEMRVHKQRRDELQAKAKELIEFKKKAKGQPMGGLKDEIRAMQADVKAMELRQQTVPLTIPKERELLDQLKKKVAEIDRLKVVLSEQEKISKEIRDIDRSIDAFFKQADKEHEEVVRLSEDQHKAHEEASALFKDIAALTAAANKKHDEFKKLKEDADASHQKAQEMRDKIIEIRKEKRMEREEERRAIRDVNVAVKRALDDKDKRDKAADEALAMLLKKGKVEIR